MSSSAGSPEGHEEQRMLGAVPGEPAIGRGPSGGPPPFRVHYHHPSAGWGAARSVGRVLARTHEPLAGPHAIVKMNHENGGFDCPGCAWPDDRKGLRLDICESGIKHVTWELTRDLVDREFFARHTVSELATWGDYDLEVQGRLAEPMVFDAASDHYVPIGWDEAFALVGSNLRGLDSPDEAAFYTSGRLGNEATFLYQLWVREFGTNNLPDCSNMCHEASGRGLTAAIGTGKGTVTLTDWEEADLLFVVGVNAATNTPRMLTALAKAYRRGAQIVHINPLVEAGATRTIVPHEFLAMATFRSTPTSTLNVQPRIGGDMALMRGIAKAVLEQAQTRPDVLDEAFLREHTSGFDAYRRRVDETSWGAIERQSAVPVATIRQLADIYIGANSTIIGWCLGITQQEHGVDSIREIVNLLLLRGNIGRPAAGPSPIRGHSNVQGNRTCGIDHRPKPEFLDRLAAVCKIDPPRAHGLDTVGTLQAMLRGEVKVFVGMGGNFAIATPDTPVAFDALRNCELTVHVSTKLNRSHIVHGRQALILPCLARSDRDMQKGGLQTTTVEDGMSMVHMSVGIRRPRARHLRSEPAIIAGMARANLPDSRTPWEEYVADYDRIRDTMAEVLDGFEEFNARVRQPLGFRIDQPARERVFLTPTGKAEFSDAELPEIIPSDGRLVLSTVRSHDQFNTSIYSNDDRYRGIKNLRTLIFLHNDDMRARGLKDFDLVDITSFARDGTKRSVYGYHAISYDLPRGNAVGYMPELNVLCALTDFSPQSDQPMFKHLVVDIEPARESQAQE